MNTFKDKILIIGGYGAVGAFISKDLAKKYPGKLIIGGRDINKAIRLIDDNSLDATPLKIDLDSIRPSEIPVAEIHTAICCVEYLKTDYFLLLCIQYKINYTELGTSYKAFQRFTTYAAEIEKSKICFIPGVGLMPGLSGIFVQDSISKLHKIRCVQSFVLLGLGENHGLDAIRWMLEYADQKYHVKLENKEKQVKSFSNPIKEQLLSENRPRKFYRFNFGDQHVIVDSDMADEAHTRIAFDSGFITWLIVILGKFGLLTILKKSSPVTVRKWLSKFTSGSENFAVQCHCYGQNSDEIIYLAEGVGEARGTAVVAAYAVTQLYKSSGNVGLRRLEEVVNRNEFFEYLRELNIKIIIKEQ